jgi:prepilin-type N-terminal cleavage/methylation domain-containing protein
VKTSRPQDLKTSRPQDLKTSRPQDLKTSRPQDLKTSRPQASKRLIITGRLKTPVPGRASKSPSIPRNGFTLIEVVVALCIVAILSAIAIPGFRKATEDFRLNEFACNFEGLIKAYRSHYLIFNQWPADVSANNIPAGNIRYFLPNHLYKGNLFIYTPLRKSGIMFDCENWIGNSGASMKTVGLTAYNLGTHFNLAWEKLQSLSDHKTHFFNINEPALTKNSDIFYRFPDIPQTNNENRYY